MSNRILYPASAFLCTIAVLAGYLLPISSNRKSVPESREWCINVVGNNFGLSHESENHVQKLTISNTSSEARHLEFDTECSCSAVLPAKVQIGSNETISILMTLNTTYRKPFQHGLPKWQHSSTLIVHDTTLSEKREFKIIGSVNAKSSSLVPWLEFGGLLTQNELGRSLTCRYKLHDDTTDIVAAEDASKYTVHTQMLSGSKEALLTVTPNTNCQPADFSFDIKIEAVGRHGNRSFVAPLRVRGYIAPTLQAYPEVVTISGRGNSSGADTCLRIMHGYQLKSIVASSDRVRS